MARRTGIKSGQARSVAKEQPLPGGDSRRGGVRTSPWLVAASVGASFALFFIIYSLRLDQVVGLVVDDAWYVMLARALATGHGYTLINSPSAGIPPFYPPAFPWLLSLLFRLAPQFPQNLWLLKSVSIMAMPGVGAASYVWLRRVRELPHYPALGIATVVSVTPAFCFLATSTVMTECVFTLAQLLTILTIERGVRVTVKGGTSWWYWVLGATFGSFAFLTRSIALGLIAAAVGYLLKERLFRGAAIFAFSVIALVGPWMAYSRAHSPTGEQRAEQGGNIVLSYTTQFWQKKAGDSASGTVYAADLPDRVWNNLTQVLGHDIGMMLFPPFLRDTGYSGAEAIEEAGGRSILSFLLGLFVVAGFIATAIRKATLAEFALPASLVIILLWPWPPYRFILPFAPFIVFYFLTGLRLIQQLKQRVDGTSKLRAQWPVFGVAVVCILAAHLYDHTRYIVKKFQPVAADRPLWLRAFEENRAMLEWVSKKAPEDCVIATPNPALVYLFTGRKTISFTNPQGNWERWNQIGMRYLVRTSVTPVPKPDVFTEARYDIPYTSRGELKLRVVDFGPPSIRLPWGSNDPSKGRIMLEGIREPAPGTQIR